MNDFYQLIYGACMPVLVLLLVAGVLAGLARRRRS